MCGRNAQATPYHNAGHVEHHPGNHLHQDDPEKAAGAATVRAAAAGAWRLSRHCEAAEHAGGPRHAGGGGLEQK
jgi:hypothetical protein